MNMPHLIKCANCRHEFVKSYRLSANRLARPMYCSGACEKASATLRARGRRKTYFWTKVQIGKQTECWPWQGYRDPNGYGRYGNIPAHRVAYELGKDEDPAGSVVCHTCDNPACVNPLHLWLGTQSDNVADMDAKGRRVLGPVRRGEKSNKAKLTSAQAQEIFNSEKSARVLAGQFKITTTAVRLIKNGRNWAHVTGGTHAR